MQANLDKPSFLYQALKVYLILGRQGPLNRGLVTHWMDSDFAANFAGPENATERAELSGDVAAMLRSPLPALALNGPLVAEVRAILTRQPFADYLYTASSTARWCRGCRSGRWRKTPGRRAVGCSPCATASRWTAACRASSPGRAITGVPAADPAGDQAGHRAGLGARAGRRRRRPEALAKLRHDVLDLYLDDYTRRWDGLLANVALKPFGTIQQGVQELYLLSAPDSPLRDLLVAIDKQTQLSRPPPAEVASEKAGKVREGLTDIAAESGQDGDGDRGGADRLRVRLRVRRRAGRQADRPGEAGGRAFQGAG